VTLLESGSFIGNIRVCRYHHRTAAATRHLDLDPKFLRARMRERLVAPPAKPELVVADVPWTPFTPAERQRITITNPAQAEKPRARRRRQPNAELGRWCITDWDKRFDEGAGQFAAFSDGTGISSVAHHSGRKIPPLPVTWLETFE
jgi:hypothetical protein